MHLHHIRCSVLAQVTGRFFIGAMVGVSLSTAYIKQNGHQELMDKVEQGYAYVEDVVQTLQEKGGKGK